MAAVVVELPSAVYNHFPPSSSSLILPVSTSNFFHYYNNNKDSSISITSSAFKGKPTGRRRRRRWSGRTNASLGLGGLLGGIFKGSDNGEATRQQYAPTVSLINAQEPQLSSLSDQQLRDLTTQLRQRAQSSDSSLDSPLPEAFAIVREASRRVLGLRPFDVQLIGGMVLHQGEIAEMRTGEGKTLVAILPLQKVSSHCPRKLSQGLVFVQTELPFQVDLIIFHKGKGLGFIKDCQEWGCGFQFI